LMGNDRSRLRRCIAVKRIAREIKMFASHDSRAMEIALQGFRMSANAKSLPNHTSFYRLLGT
jgi:hypothetical protein